MHSAPQFAPDEDLECDKAIKSEFNVTLVYPLSSSGALPHARTGSRTYPGLSVVRSLRVLG